MSPPKGKKRSQTKLLPFVSVCTPTFNRRPFIPYMIECFEKQTYPKDRIEWIIVDDGTDPLGNEMFSQVPQVKYFYSPERMVLGRKRNYMHEKCKGDIIVYMDDDDYYPPERVEHAVTKLMEQPTVLIAGSSEMHMFFTDIQKMFQCGPYGLQHATAATFAFKKELLSKTRYDDSKALAEESQFLHSYSFPMIQLDTKKTILVFSHCHNTFDKKMMLENMESTKTKPSPYTVDDFIKNDDKLKNFYMKQINTVLEPYAAGRAENKPEVLQQIQKTKEEREKKQKEMEENAMLQSMRTQCNQIIQDLEKKHKVHLEEKNRLIQELLKKIKDLSLENMDLKRQHLLPQPPPEPN